MQDVTIADNVIIGANAIVTKDITEPNSVWSGIPAKKYQKMVLKNVRYQTCKFYNKGGVSDGETIYK